MGPLFCSNEGKLRKLEYRKEGMMGREAERTGREGGME